MSTLGSEPYRHAFQHAAVPGGIAVLDVLDSPTGARYAVGTVVGSNSEFEPLVAQTGVFELQRSSAPTSTHPRLVDTAPVMALDLEGSLIAEPDAPRLVNLYLARPAGLSTPVEQLERAIAEGLVQTSDERAQVRAAIMADRRHTVAASVSPVAAWLQSVGGTVVRECQHSFCLQAILNTEQIRQAAANPEIRRIDPVRALNDDTINGTSVAAGTQIQQFYDGGYHGNTTGRVKAGIIEHGGLAHHQAFCDTYLFCYSRVVQKRECDSGSCSTVGTFGSSTSHTNRVAGILIGDLMDNQDSSWTSSPDDSDRSGYGREASLYFWRAVDDNDIVTAFDDVQGYDLQVLSVSISMSGDTDCHGDTTTSRELNDVFEAGITTFKSAGNNGSSSTCSNNNPTNDCTVEEPGSAMGAFVVGAHANDFVTEGEADVRDGCIAGYSDRGGVSWGVGRDRTIIDITAAGTRATVANNTSTYSSFSGTSASTPTVAGAAIPFIDWYRDVHSSAIENPGTLTANLLLMGDRANDNGVDRTSAYSNLWGAGRLKARRWDSTGLDNPAWWGSLNTCISHGEYYYHPIGSGSLSSDFDVLKVVAFWFDRRHEDGTSIDDINIAIQEKVGSTWYTRRTDNDHSDEKARVYWDDFSGGNEWRIRLHGNGVTSDGCGGADNSIRVYFAYLAEDSDREPGENLDGVDPEDS